MNQDLQENRTRKLFRELRHEDERLAPSFARVMEEALSKREPARKARLALRAAMIATVVLFVVGSAFFLLKPSSTETLPVVKEKPREPIPAPQPPDIIGQAGVVSEPVKKVSRKNRRRPSPESIMQSARLISEWRSPTESLMNAPGREILKTLPRLDESQLKIEVTYPLEKN